MHETYGRNDMVQLEEVMLIVETPKAYGVSVDTEPFGDQDPKTRKQKQVDFWIAKSMADNEHFQGLGSCSHVSMPFWWIEQEELEHLIVN